MSRTGSPKCYAAAHAVTTLPLASHHFSLSFPGSKPNTTTIPSNTPSSSPPSYGTTQQKKEDASEDSSERKRSVLHPRVAVLLGVERRWHFPLLFCRGLSTVPAMWWGLRCAFTFMGELLMDDEYYGAVDAPWSGERRFRLTEVFLAVLWV